MMMMIMMLMMMMICCSRWGGCWTDFEGQLPALWGAYVASLGFLQHGVGWRVWVRWDGWHKWDGWQRKQCCRVGGLWGDGHKTTGVALRVCKGESDIGWRRQLCSLQYHAEVLLMEHMCQRDVWILLWKFRWLVMLEILLVDRRNTTSFRTQKKLSMLGLWGVECLQLCLPALVPPDPATRIPKDEHLAVSEATTASWPMNECFPQQSVVSQFYFSVQVCLLTPVLSIPATITQVGPLFVDWRRWVGSTWQLSWF